MASSNVRPRRVLLISAALLGSMSIAVGLHGPRAQRAEPRAEVASDSDRVRAQLHQGARPALSAATQPPVLQRTPAEAADAREAPAGAAPRVEVRMHPDEPYGGAASRQGNDPVAAAIPMLSDRTKAQQLRTSRWMASIPAEKLVSAFPDLADSEVPLAEREHAAREWLATLARDLERDL